MAGNQMLGNLGTINKMVDFANKNSFKCDAACQQKAKSAGHALNFSVKVNEYAALMDVTKTTNLLSLQKKYYDSLGSDNYDNMLNTKTQEMWRQKKAMLKLQQKRQLSASPSAAGPSFQLTLDGLEPGWQKLLKPEANRDYFKSMKSFLGKETAHHRVYPPAN